MAVRYSRTAVSTLLQREYSVGFTSPRACAFRPGQILHLGDLVMTSTSNDFRHPLVSRRTAIRAGAVGLLGLGTNHLQALRAADVAQGGSREPRARSCIYIFLSGGLAQLDSFDLKPRAPAEVRGEFRPIATKTPDIQICEHLPLLAQRSDRWALVRSLTHPTNGHTKGHFFMLTGRSVTPPGFKGDRVPRSTDWPSIASVVGDALPAANHNLPPAVVLPERLVHWSGGVIPGAYGGMMGHRRDPFFIEATNYGDPFWRGAYPQYTFYQLPKREPSSRGPAVFQAPDLSLLPGMHSKRFDGRLKLLETIDTRRRALEQSAEAENYDRHRQSAISLLASPAAFRRWRREGRNGDWRNRQNRRLSRGQPSEAREHGRDDLPRARNPANRRLAR